MDKRYWSDPDDVWGIGESRGSSRQESGRHRGSVNNQGARSGANPRGRKKPKKKRRVLKGILITLLVLILLIVAAAGVMFALLKPPERTVFLIAATDEEGTRTDTIMLGVLNAKDKCDLTLVSIPRDTLVTVSKENYAKMRESYPEPGSRSMKINEVYHFAGDDAGMEMLVGEIESKFDVKIDYYAKIDFEAFGYIVDSIGGVTFEVPQDMDYEDPYQDLSIHLKKGVQVLDGDKAEQLLRYRSGYAMADLERIEVQQRFMQAFISEAMKPKTVAKNYKAYITACEEYVETNLKVKDMFKYVRCVFMFGDAQVNTGTVPGRLGRESGRDGYLIDYEEFEELYADKFR